MVDSQLVKQKIAQIQSDLIQLKKYEDYTLDQVASDYSTHKVIERILEVIINEAIDINQHIVSKINNEKLKFEFRQTFLELAELDILKKDFAEEISNSVGLRNILVHQYRKLDEEIFYNSIKQCLEQYTKYCKYILDYLEK